MVVGQLEFCVQQGDMGVGLAKWGFHLFRPHASAISTVRCVDDIGSCSTIYCSECVYLYLAIVYSSLAISRTYSSHHLPFEPSFVWTDLQVYVEGFVLKLKLSDFCNATATRHLVFAPMVMARIDSR